MAAPLLLLLRSGLVPWACAGKTENNNNKRCNSRNFKFSNKTYPAGKFGDVVRGPADNLQDSTGPVVVFVFDLHQRSRRDAVRGPVSFDVDDQAIRVQDLRGAEFVHVAGELHRGGSESRSVSCLLNLRH